MFGFFPRGEKAGAKLPNCWCSPVQFFAFRLPPSALRDAVMSADSASLSSRISPTIRQLVPRNEEQPFPRANPPHRMSRRPRPRLPAPATRIAPATSPPAGRRKTSEACVRRLPLHRLPAKISRSPRSGAGRQVARRACESVCRSVCGFDCGVRPWSACKSYVRSAPGNAGEKLGREGQGKTPITRETSVKEYGKMSGGPRAASCSLVALVHNWILRQPGPPGERAGLGPGQRWKILRRALIEARYDPAAVVASTAASALLHVARALGRRGRSLLISAICGKCSR